MYLPDRFIKPGDAVATAHAIAANEFLFRVAIVTDVVAGIVWLLIVLALYQLLRDVDSVQAALMVLFGALLQVPFYFANALNYVAALLFVGPTGFLSAFSETQRDALAMLFLRLHHYELFLSFVFAGLWLFPFGILVYKSGFLPRLLGIWLVVDGFGWLAMFLSAFLWPDSLDAVLRITSPIRFAEIAIMLWLLIVGARTLGAPGAARM